MHRRCVKALNRNYEAIREERDLQVADEAWRREIPRPTGPKYIVTKTMGKKRCVRWDTQVGGGSSRNVDRFWLGIPW